MHAHTGTIGFQAGEQVREINVLPALPSGPQ